MDIVHPIDRAWLSTGGTGAQNYDEFADDAEITAIIAANPRSALAVEMPHCAPGGPTTFSEALPAAVARLAEAKSAGAYRDIGRAVVLYRITGGDGAAMHGLFAMVDTSQISSGPDEPGLVIRNEDVFEEKVRERVALTRATGHLLSPVLLLQTARAGELDAALRDAVAQAGAPAVTDRDQAGRLHEVWPVPAGPTAERLCALAGGGELVVADGNHRTLAAQTGGLARFLAVVTTPDAVTIAPYNRLILELPEVDQAALARLSPRPAGEDPPLPPPRGAAYLYRDGRFTALTLPADPGAPAVDNLDHALVERHLLRGAFGLDPGDKRIAYVGGDYPVSWLRGEVDAGRADAAIIIAPVRTDDFVSVNLARHKMPRKSTWFTPKARAGLVLAELTDAPAAPAG
ncbi:MAG: DUF1015 family protein [Micromonosporaceae bacterium]